LNEPKARKIHECRPDVHEFSREMPDVHAWKAGYEKNDLQLEKEKIRNDLDGKRGDDETSEIGLIYMTILCRSDESGI